ncbi:hypothetical protein MKX03_019364 [Papaver bracteatum]|nr:hypothetical protein MKX03_019364 [Papaver bracteatum]
MVFDGETSVSPIFLVKKPVNFLASKDLAHVISCQGIKGLNTSSNKELIYEIIGSMHNGVWRCMITRKDL